MQPISLPSRSCVNDHTFKSQTFAVCDVKSPWEQSKVMNPKLNSSSSGRIVRREVILVVGQKGEYSCTRFAIILSHLARATTRRSKATGGE